MLHLTPNPAPQSNLKQLRPLTEKQLILLSFLIRSIKQGYVPTIREMANRLGVKYHYHSGNAPVRHKLYELQRKGYISLLNGRKAHMQIHRLPDGSPCSLRA